MSCTCCICVYSPMLAHVTATVHTDSSTATICGAILGGAVVCSISDISSSCGEEYCTSIPETKSFLVCARLSRGGAHRSIEPARVGMLAVLPPLLSTPIHQGPCASPMNALQLQHRQLGMTTLPLPSGIPCPLRKLPNLSVTKRSSMADSTAHLIN